MSIETLNFEWPSDLDEKKNLNIETNYGRLKVELFVQEAPITCWQWTAQAQQKSYKPIILGGNARYIEFSRHEPIFDIGERNMLPVERGSIVFDPKTSKIWLSMEEHPEDLGAFLVIGKVIQGQNILRQLRIQEQIKKISISHTSIP